MLFVMKNGLSLPSRRDFLTGSVSAGILAFVNSVANAGTTILDRPIGVGNGSI